MQRKGFARLFASPLRGDEKHPPRPRPRPDLKRPRSATTPTPTTTPQGSRFVECPLCSKYFHSCLAQSHVDECLSVYAEARGRPSSPLKTTQTQLVPSPRNSEDSSIRSPNGEAGRASEGYIAPLVSSALHCEEYEVMPLRLLRISGGGSMWAGESARKVRRGKGNSNNSGSMINSNNDSIDITSSGNENNTRAENSNQLKISNDSISVGASILEISNKTNTWGGNNPSSAPATDAIAVATASQSTATGDISSPSIPAKNAFSKMMEASALADFREEMYLWAHDDGTLSWGWGHVGDPRPVPPKASAEATPVPYSEESSCAGGHGGYEQRQQEQQLRRWSCRVATKGPDGCKAGTCELWTNLPSATAMRGQGETIAADGVIANGKLAVAGGDGNAGVQVARPGQSLSRLPVPVLKSMLQKNIRRGNAEAASRCALELAVKSWSDAIRRLLVIVVEDSLLHPAAPLLSWLMVATSKGYRPPSRLVDAFLSVVYETATCPVRDTIDSCLLLDAITGRSINLGEDDSPVPHPRDLIPPNKSRNPPEPNQPNKSSAKENPKNVYVPLIGGRVRDNDIRAGDFPRRRCSNTEAAIDSVDVGDVARSLIACCRRALLLRMSYGGMACDQALLKGSCLAWGERCRHRTVEHAGSKKIIPKYQRSSAPPAPPPRHAAGGARPGNVTPPFGYIHNSVLLALEQDPWMDFILSAHDGGGMPSALRSTLLAHVATVSESKPKQSTWGKAMPRDSKPSMRDRTRTNRQKRGTREGGSSPVAGGTGAERLATAAATRGGGPILREADAALSGVDFHCSKVLDDVLRSAATAKRVGSVIQAAASERGPLQDTHFTAVGPSPSLEPTREAIMHAINRAMWACSSGVNRRELRLAFRTATDEGRGSWGDPAQSDLVAVFSPWSSGDGASDIDVRVWDVISTDVLRWARNFVRGRLAPGVIDSG